LPSEADLQQEMKEVALADLRSDPAPRCNLRWHPASAWPLQPGNRLMELGAEIEGGLIDALSGHSRVQIQVIACGTAPEAAIHLPPHMHGERAAAWRLRAMNRAGATQPRGRGSLRLKAKQFQNLRHGDLGAQGSEIDAWHHNLPSTHARNRKEEPVGL